MDNNVIVSVNLIKGNISHNVGHENNIYCLPIDEVAFVFY